MTEEEFKTRCKLHNLIYGKNLSLKEFADYENGNIQKPEKGYGNVEDNAIYGSVSLQRNITNATMRKF